jgi:hypothetical protein
MVPSWNFEWLQTGKLIQFWDHDSTSNLFQSKITAATENLRPLLRSHQTGASSRANRENFHPGTDVPTGMITLSPAWFQQGHHVSSLA